MTRLAHRFMAQRFMPVLALIAVAGLTTAARAADEPPVVRALLDSTAITAADRPTYGSLNVAADGTITLTDFITTFGTDSDPEFAMSYEVGELVLSGVSEIAAGLFEVASAEWVGVEVTVAGESAVAIPLMTAGSLYIQQPGNEPSAIDRLRASNVLAREFTMPEALALVDDQAVVIEDLSGTWDGDPVTGSGTSQFSVRRVHVPAGVFAEGDNPLAMAGYDELELSMSGTSTTTYSGEAVGFDLAMTINGRDVGSLIVELGADGIPLALFAAIDTETDPDALMPFADTVSLKRARIRFEDDSLTGRILSLMAEAEGTDVASFVAEGTAGLEMSLAEFLEPELARQVSDALTAYLNDPRSITFALSPAQPVNFAQVMAALENPAGLIEMLQPTVTAND
ncbi:MAG TPA: hypothetical protein VMO81_03890 [Aestuariivirgaceae bacterium]|nr:hypothetical protein [Aestuariivirgaceae bacterium]